MEIRSVVEPLYGAFMTARDGVQMREHARESQLVCNAILGCSNLIEMNLEPLEPFSRRAHFILLAHQPKFDAEYLACFPSWSDRGLSVVVERGEF